MSSTRHPHRPIAACLLAVAVASAPTAAQASRASVAEPTAATLAAITARGRAMARFQAEAAAASSALLQTRQDTARTRQYVVRESADGGWAVRFGRLNAARDTFYEAFMVTPGATGGALTIQQREPGRVGAEVDRAAAAAARRAQDALGRTTRPYNTFVIPAGAGEWWVYLLPAQTVAAVYPHGGDVRYRVSGDGRRILATHRMHDATAEVRLDATATEHAHGPMSGELPEDSDVYFVLTRRPLVPELMETPRHDYRIDTGGAIHVVPHERAGRAGDRAGRG